MNKKKSIIAILLATFFISMAQIFFKIGSQSLNYEWSSFVFNLPLFFGFSSYAVGAVLVILAIKGNALTIIYPIVTSSYVWVFLISVYYFDEIFSLSKILGILMIVLGIIIINVEKKSPVVSLHD